MPKTNSDRLGNRTPSETSAAYAIPAADSAGKLSSGWGGSASTLCPLDASVLVPLVNIPTVLTGKTAENATNAADSALLGGVARTALPGALVWDKLISGAAVTSVTTDGEVTLDGIAHGGYDFEFVIYNPTVGTVQYRTFFNNNTTVTNYYHAHSGSGPGNDAYFPISNQTGIITLGWAFCNGSISIHNDKISAQNSYTLNPWGAGVMAFNNSLTTKTTVSFTNLTRIDIVSDTENAIGINSRFRLWRRI